MSKNVNIQDISNLIIIYFIYYNKKLKKFILTIFTYIYLK